MYSSHLDSHDTARLTVADILSTMGSAVEAMTPTTLSLLDGLTGVPTRTTPTLTPTTLRNIEQTFMDLAASQVSHEREAGFVPPMVPATNSLSSSASNYTVTVTTSTQQDVKPSWMSVPQPSSSISPPMSRGRRMSVGSNSSESNSNLSSAAMNQNSSSSSGQRRGGGRRKEDRAKEDCLSEEELSKRIMRRERNKQAAARCRKRRMDHTMALQQETDVWEEKKQALQKELQELQKQKEELEHLLETHRPQCKMMRKSNFTSKLPTMPNLMPIPSIKKEKIESDESSSETSDYILPNEFVPPSAPRPRPTSLPVASPFTAPPPRSSASWQEIAGIAITTPSTGIPGFNFDSLMEGGTGLTPVMPSPSCGTQQQRNNSSNNNSALPVDLSSPDAVNRKLVSL